MTSRELAERLLALSEGIEHAMLLADWLEAARLTEERSPLLMSLTAVKDYETRHIIRRIQEIDAGVLVIAQTNRVELHAEYQAAMRHIDAVNQYQRIARY